MKNEILLVRQINEEYKSRGGGINERDKMPIDGKIDERDVKLPKY